MFIDTHSHIGIDYYFKGAKLEDYDAFCVQNKIDKSVLMPMPWPVYNQGNKEIVPLIWEHENFRKINYYKLIIENETIKKEPANKNPYQCINEFYLKLICKDFETKLYFAPLIHGVLDEPYYLEKLLLNKNVVATKMHGFSGGFFKDDVKKELIEVIKAFDIPIIFHTSVYNYNYGYGAETRYWRNKCSPKDWAEFIIKYDLKGVLNHGACLDLETIKLVNKNPNIMIGIGPDLDISQDPFKVSLEKNTFLKEGYLNLLKKYVNPDRLLFDVDYNWNVDQTGFIDNCSINRIMSTWNYEDSQKILSKNALAFYKKLK